jgi:hypothetical protein
LTEEELLTKGNDGKWQETCVQLAGDFILHIYQASSSEVRTILRKI